MRAKIKNKKWKKRQQQKKDYLYPKKEEEKALECRKEKGPIADKGEDRNSNNNNNKRTKKDARQQENRQRVENGHRTTAPTDATETAATAHKELSERRQKQLTKSSARDTNSSQRAQRETTQTAHKELSERRHKQLTKSSARDHRNSSQRAQRETTETAAPAHKQLSERRQLHETNHHHQLNERQESAGSSGRKREASEKEPVNLANGQIHHDCDVGTLSPLARFSSAGSSLT